MNSSNSIVKIKFSIFPCILILAACNFTLRQAFSQDPSKMVGFFQSYDLTRGEIESLSRKTNSGDRDALIRLFLYFWMVEEDVPSAFYYRSILASLHKNDYEADQKIFVDSLRKALKERIKLASRAKSGDVDAAIELGNHYWCVSNQRKTARKFFKIAAEVGGGIHARRLARVDRMLSGDAPTQGSGGR